MSSKSRSSSSKASKAPINHVVANSDSELPQELVSELRGTRNRSADYDLVTDALQAQPASTLNDILIGVYQIHRRILKRSQLIGLLAGLKRNGRVVKEGSYYRLSPSESAQVN